MAVIFKPKDSYVFHDHIKSGYVICHITMYRRDWLFREQKNMVRARLMVATQWPLEFEPVWACDVSRNNVQPASNNKVIMDKFSDWFRVREDDDE